MRTGDFPMRKPMTPTGKKLLGSCCTSIQIVGQGVLTNRSLASWQAKRATNRYAVAFLAAAIK
ncbi:hypothetical protein FBZ93_12278 [Bradyrhizobium macuxiense]|uniref:Uncharacterized protein n=1 Tax=Bradyrhizobium macuxiense TaxID=1755647 RepID=A0A560KVZ7_9BRAD|nr:hypothetical protein FBZ93_12278 [Bradyrhizobium macuxiense]